MTLSASPPARPARGWPRIPRIGIALVAASAVVAALLSLGGFLVAGMTEPSAEAVWRVTAVYAGTLSLLVFGFGLTFGIAGTALLRMMGKRGVLAWSLTGAASGVIAGSLFTAIAMAGVNVAVVLGFAFAGWAVFLLIRAFAGVRRHVAG